MSMFIIPYFNIHITGSSLNEFNWEMIFTQYEHRGVGHELK